jgi:hypothetical protein
MSVGRNDPCPCGSGEKYKKCCLKKSEPSADEMFWQRLHRDRNELIGMTLKHAVTVYGPNVISAAWDEFHQWNNEDGFDPNSPEIQLFMPWFFYDWTPDTPDDSLLETAPADTPPAQSLLETKGARLSPLQRKYIELCTMTGFSFHEILEAWPGKGFKTKDVLTDELDDIVEKQGSIGAKVGYLLFGKTVTIQGLTTLEATSSIMIPPIFKIQILNLRQHLEKQNPIITRDTLWEYDSEIQSLYQTIYNAVMNPQMPTPHNTDGDLLVPHKLTYDLLVSPDDALSALADLSCSESKEEIRENGEIENGKLKKVEFSWSKKGNAKNAGMENTILGHIEINGPRMVVNMNSENRANEFEGHLKERLNGGFKLKHRVIESIEQGLKNRRPPSSISQSKQEELMKHPEIQAKIAQMMKVHWDNWIYSKIPALNGQTPIEAVKTKAGRDALDALLTQFEIDAERAPQPGAGPELFQEIRTRLGL